MSLYIGLMTGSSMDALDVAVIDMRQPLSKALLAYQEFAYPDHLRQLGMALCLGEEESVQALAHYDMALAHWYADCVALFLGDHRMHADEITAIGTHGQTIRHAPDATLPFTVQLGNASTLAALTGIDVIANFRAKDIAYGGQGAPFAPAFHAALFAESSEKIQCVVNLGGIANVTVLDQADGGQKVFGFDTGPGNALIDAWYAAHHGGTFDASGAWAAQGQVIPELLEAMLQDPYFHRPAPKSTGRDYFHLDWLKSFLTKSYRPVDVQATCTALTVQSIIHALAPYHQGKMPLWVAGGGCFNDYLMSLLAKSAHVSLHHLSSIGMRPEALEAMLFAWFAYKRCAKEPICLQTVTGAKRSGLYGGWYSGC